MNEILLNFTPQEHEDFVEWKKRGGSKLVDSKNNSVGNDKIEILALENSPNPNQSLLNSKKEKLAKLENKLKENNQQNEQNNKTKLILGIGLGIFGVGLIGLVVWLVARRKEVGG
jgi:hypothetical protein